MTRARHRLAAAKLAGWRRPDGKPIQMVLDSAIFADIRDATITVKADCVVLNYDGALAKKPRIERPFGSRALSFYRLACSNDTYATIFAQIVADRRHEINEALSVGEHHRVRWIVARGWFDLLDATLALVAGRLLKTLATIRKLIG